MWNRQEIKAGGKAAFKANYWRSVGVSFLLSLLIGGTAVAARVNSGSPGTQGQQSLEEASGSIPELPPALIAIIAGVILAVIIVSLLLRIFLYNPLKVGCYQFFEKNQYSPDTSLDMIMTGFSRYGRTFLTLFLTDLYTALWCILLIIPGLIKAYSYRLVPYLIVDEPDLKPGEVITLSRQLMKGHKWAAFVYDLSFLGWELLGIITLGLVDVFWTRPYKNNADAALYNAIRNHQ